jgi:hypothetical protein
MASSSHDISNDEGHAEVSEAELAQVRVSVSDTFERLAAAEQSTLHRFGHAAKILHSPLMGIAVFHTHVWPQAGSGSHLRR